jgi:hypothetical protein
MAKRKCGKPERLCAKPEGKSETAKRLLVMTKRFVEKAEGKSDLTKRNTIKTPLTSIIRKTLPGLQNNLQPFAVQKCLS